MKTVLLSSLLSLGTLYGFSQQLNTPTLSPFAKMEQQVGLTNIGLEYSRPSAKGRKVFGELVPFGETWRTGANASTKLIVKETVWIAGNKLSEGKYALYTIPGEAEWTIIVHNKIDMRSIAGDQVKPENDVFRFKVKPEKTDSYTETFTMGFSDLKSDELTLYLAWENTLVSFPITVDVDSKIEAQMNELLKNPETIPDRVYFEAAQYYLHNDKDLDKALEWIDAALERSPKNFRYGLLKARIEYKKGDQKTALKTIKMANKWAHDVNNANYIEQTQLFWDSIK